MKSKVILFCVLLFCSKIVDSIPHSEDPIGQRVTPLSTWNVQNGQNRDTDVINTRNVNIQQEMTQDTNQGRYNYDNNGYNRSPASLAAGPELLVNYDSSGNGRRLDSSKVSFDNQQYGNQNWRSQSQYANSDQRPVLIPDDENVPLRYLVPKYPSSNRQVYQSGVSFNRYQPQQYVGNFVPPFVSRGPIPYDTYSDDQVPAAQRQARPSGGQRYWPGIINNQPRIIYDKAPAIIAAGTLTDQSEVNSDLSNMALVTNYDDGSPVKSEADNDSLQLDSKPSNDPIPYEIYGDRQVSEVQSRTIGGNKYAHRFVPVSEIKNLKTPAADTLEDQPNYIKYTHLSNTAPIKNHYDSSPLMSVADNINSDSIPSNLARVNFKKEAPVVINKNLSERPLAWRYANNHGSDSGWNNVARDDSSNGVTETVAVKSGKYEANYKSEGPKEPVPINNNNHEESNVPHHGSSNPTTLNTNPKQNVFQKLFSGIEEHSLRRLAANPEKQNISKENKQYVVVHSNRTVEYLNRRDIDSHQSSKLRLIHTKPNNNVKPSVPVDVYPLPTNNQTADVKKSTPLHVDQANPAYDSNVSPPLKDLPADHSNLKALPQPEKQPADNNGDDNSKPLTQNEDQSEQNDNLKPFSQDVNRSRDDNDSKPMTLQVNQTAADGNSKPLPQDRNQRADLNEDQLTDDNLNSELDHLKDKNSFTLLFPNTRKPVHVKKPKNSYKHPTNDFQDNSESLRSNKNQPDDDRPFHHHKRHHHTSRHSPVNQPTEDSNPSTTPKLFTYPEKHQGFDNDFKSLPAYATHSANDKKSKPSHGIQGGDDNNSTPSSPHENQPEEDNKSKPAYATHSANDKKSKPSHGIQRGDDNNSTPSSPHENQPEEDNKSKPAYATHSANDKKSKPSHGIQRGDDNNSTPSSPHENQPEEDNKSKPAYATHSANDKKSKPSQGIQGGDDNNSTPSSPHENQPEEDNKSKPAYATHSANDKKSKSSHGIQGGDDNNSTPSSPHENQPEEDNKSKPAYVTHSANDKKSKPSQGIQGGDDSNSTPSSPHENQPEEDNKSKPVYATHSANDKKSKSSHGIQGGDDNNSTPSSPHENQPEEDNKSKPAYATHSANDKKSKPSHGIQGGDDNNSTPSSPHENQPEEDNKSKPLGRNENQPTDDIKSEPTPKSPKSTTYSPVVSTTPYSDYTAEDQFITLAPIEQATDNVSDVPLVATTTTRPNESSGKLDIISVNDAKNKQDDVQDDTAQSYSTTTISPSNSASPTNIISDDKTIGTIENKNTETNDKTVVDQVNGEKDTHTAVYNSSELFDTITDVPAESDDYSSVTASPSVQNDVNTGDVSGDNALELDYSETDVTITVSSNTDNDSEDEIISINIEVSESTDDADSSSSDKSLVVSIDTNDGNDDDSKTPKPEDRKKDRISNDGKGNNVEIDMSNLKGEPTIWIRTTNQDFIDKLTAKNDTEFDVIYFFHIENLPAIEREKATTIYCNGTLVTETTEITYAHKDDTTPTIVRTTKTTQNEE